MRKVKFIGAIKEQLNWGGKKDNPNDFLKIGEEYEVVKKEVHSWHTVLFIKGYEDKSFPSGAFEDV